MPGAEWLPRKYLLNERVKPPWKNTFILRLSELIGVFCEKTQESKVAVSNILEGATKFTASSNLSMW